MDYQQILHVSSNCVISQQIVRMLSHLISSLIIYCLIVEDSPWWNSFKLVSKGNVSGLLLKESKINTAAGAGSFKYLSLGIIRSRRCQSPVDTPRGEPFISFDEHFKWSRHTVNTYLSILMLIYELWNSNSLCWFFFCGSNADVIENSFSETKTFFALQTTYVPTDYLGYNKKSFNNFAWERCLFIKNLETPTEIAIHHLTDETKLAVVGEADIVH